MKTSHFTSSRTIMLPGKTPPFVPKAYASFADQLLDWHDQYGRHNLPWQHPRTPYRVWLSEIMLQQTQVTTVIPYFSRFVTHFPEIYDLAAADIDEVLALWSGLGYYARARNLHRTARIIADKYDGQFPENAEALEVLPGIGRSTANAIVAQAYNQPAPILDGNVKRILARQIMLDQPTIKAIKPLWAIAAAITPNHHAADFTQAIMDLGATICRRTRPNCPSCPVQSSCQAYQTDRVSEFPVSNPKKPKPQRQQDFFLYLYATAPTATPLVYLIQRPSSGIWGGLWCLPEQPISALHPYSNAQSLTPIRHTFTHYHLALQPQLYRLSQPAALNLTTVGEWLSPQQALKKGLPAPIRLLIERIAEPDLLDEIN